jgi:Ala-tRNA(Pro) deacylase
MGASLLRGAGRQPRQRTLIAHALDAPVSEENAASPEAAHSLAPQPDDFSRGPEKPLFAFLERIGVGWSTVLHPPVFTVADGHEIKADIAGGHSKNLFMKDKKGALVLVSAWQGSVLPLNRLHREIGVQRLSFTDADLLWRALGVTPGSVTAFALLNDSSRQVRFVLDAALAAHGIMNFHPLRCDMTTSISVSDFNRFIAETGHVAQIVDFSRLAQDA